MTQQIINLGTADKGNGDVLRTAFGKVNANFAELYNQIATSVVVGATAPTGPEEGALWWNSESGRMYVYFGTAWVDASPVDGAGISSTNELVNGAHTVSLGSDGTLTLPDSTVQSTAWTGITGFGEGFSLTAADKIVTNKLYSTNLTQPTQHYRLELDTNGVVVLPDGSIINGSTIRGVAGTGELNYTGIATEYIATNKSDGKDVPAIAVFAIDIIHHSVGSP